MIEMAKFIESTSYPGFGYIEPYMDEDDPLIEKYVGEYLAKELNDWHNDYRRVLKQYLEIFHWHRDANKSNQLWKELDEILLRHDEEDEKEDIRVREREREPK
jgi:hypothetical protein